MTKLKRVERARGAEVGLGRTTVRCHRCLTLLFLFRGRNSGYQIFAASLTHNASLDKPESLFTVAGYSFVAFSFEAAPAGSDSFCARAPCHFNLQPTREISSCPPSNLRRIECARSAENSASTSLSLFSFFFFALLLSPRGSIEDGKLT